MEAKEIMTIIVFILASLGLLACFISAVYCLYSMIMTDRQLKRELKRMNDERAKLEKEE